VSPRVQVSRMTDVPLPVVTWLQHVTRSGHLVPGGGTHCERPLSGELRLRTIPCCFPAFVNGTIGPCAHSQLRLAGMALYRFCVRLVQLHCADFRLRNPLRNWVDGVIRSCSFALQHGEARYGNRAGPHCFTAYCKDGVDSSAARIQLHPQPGKLGSEAQAAVRRTRTR